jgi:protein SCO1
VVSKRSLLIAAAFFALLGLGMMGVTRWLLSDGPDSGTSLVGGPFALVDQDGRAVDAASFKGAPFLVFFGYTHCPDVCPTTLADMSQMLAVLGKDKPVRAAFVTVDPERDTPAVLKDYLSSFDPRITGLTGSPDAVAAAEKAYRVYARKVPTQGGDYSMDHTAIVYLMDREGRFVQAFNLQQPPEKAAAEVAAYL